ncbi:hypothetical protein GCM10007161_16590 [Ignatzschineria indica]|nr:glycosyltransferase [Ignatzschineria indica]GGZ85360.1 hypothetical protein GCM10007161_16590 [Ignatzschineria indica]
MKISIIIPIYNVEAEIQHCLKSVLEQDYSNIELILVDDCTPDNSIDLALTVIEAYKATKRTILVQHKENKGLSAARNSGIDASSGDYLFFLDSDDSLSYPSAITDLVSLVKSDEECCDVVIGNFEKVTPQGDTLEIGFQKDLCSSSTDEIYHQYVEGRLTVTAWGKLVLRDLIIENNLYFEEGIYHEDELWSFLLYRNVKSLRATSMIVYDYLEREGSISFSIKEKNVVDLNFVIEKMYQQYLVENNPFYQKLIALKIEKLKRRSLKWMANFNDDFIKQQLVILKKIKTKMATSEIKYIEQLLLLSLPIKLVIAYLKFRWGK